jgi:uncharacterized surface protein with fasciclin (FAS1) repeats
MHYSLVKEYSLMKKRIAIAGLVMSGLLLTACGDDADDTATTETVAPGGDATTTEAGGDATTTEGGADTTAGADTTGAADSTAPSDSAAAGEEGDIVAVATEAGSFNTLLAAATAAGLVETLQQPGPYTVFAPTDEAFAKLPAGVLDKLLLPENKQVLTDILLYHVVPAEVLAADVTAGDVETVQGDTIAVTTDGGVTLNGTTKVVTTDVKASNGVIHVIDSVLLPPGVDPAAL